MTGLVIVVYIACSVLSIISDIKQFQTRIFDIAVGSVLVVILKAFSPQTDWQETLIGVFASSVSFMTLFLLGKGKLGFGDVLYSAFSGLTFGFWVWDIGVFIAALAGILWILGGKLLRKGDEEIRSKKIPFVPFLCFGCLLAWITRVVLI